MTANKFKRLSLFQFHFKQNRTDKKLLLMLLVLNVMALPYLYFTSIIQIRSFNTSMIITFFAFAFIFGSAILIPLVKFSYMNQKAKVDMIYSLPLTRKQQFMKDYFSGLRLLLFPYLLQMLLSFILCICLPERTELTGLKNGSYYDFRAYRTLENLWDMFVLTIIILFMLLFLYTLTVFVISCTGSLFEAITASLYTNLLLPLFLFSIDYNIIGSLYSIQSSEVIYRLLERTSPIGGLLYLINNFYQTTPLILLGFLLPYTLVIGCFFALAYFIQIKRRAEEVTTPFVIKPLYYIDVSMLLFIIGSFLFKTDMGYFNIFIILTILFFLMELITKRGFGKLYYSLPRYAITLVSLLFFLFLYTKTDGFGLVYRITAPSNMNSVSVEYDPSFLGLGFSINSTAFQDEKNLDLLRNLQRTYIEKYKLGEISEREIEKEAVVYETKAVDPDHPVDEIQEPKYSFTMHFDVKLGIDYTRTYEITADDFIRILPLALESEAIESLRSTYENSEYLVISDIYNQNQITLNKTKINHITDIKNALFADMAAISYEDYIAPAASTGVMISFDHQRIIAVNPGYTNLIAYMKENNLWIDTAVTNYDSLVASSNVYLVAPEDIPAKTQYHYSREDYISSTAKCKLTQATPDITQLLNAAQYQHVTEESCYYLYIDAYRYVLPPSYNTLAAQVYEEYVRR